MRRGLFYLGMEHKRSILDNQSERNEADYKLICSDLDGTLLNNNQQISSIQKSCIEWAIHKKGIPFVLVSARMPSAITEFYKELDLDSASIAYSGAYIYDSTNVYFHKAIDLCVAEQLYVAAKHLELQVSLYVEDEWYVNQITKCVENEINAVHITPTVIDLDCILKECKKSQRNIYKMIATSSCSEKMAEFKKITLHMMENHLPFQIGYEDNHLMEIMPENVSKGKAVYKLCQMLQISPSQVIAIGDGDLDISMVETAGYGIAMGNAVRELKEKANYVTKTNDEDGVAAAIQWILGRNDAGGNILK